MSLRSLPSHFLPSGVAPLAAVLLIAVAAPSTTLTAATQPDTSSAPTPPDTVLVDTPLAATPIAAHTRAELEAEAIALADEFGAVPADDSGRLCPLDDLEVRWEEPTGYTHGAFIAPVGPAPQAATTDVNGVVVCGEATWAYMGFEAARADGRPWTVTAVPYVAEAEHAPAELNLDADVAGPAPAEDGHDHGEATGKPAPAPRELGSVATSAWLAGLGPIEGYAAYDPQSACSPTAKPGTVTLKDSLLAAYPVTRNLGIARACHLGGRSEHKEGRAFDWGAYVTRAGERASVEQFLTQLLATDADGNRHALARRMGVMYVIWNGKIWSSHRPGWRTYGGPNPHTDHVHVSLSRAGGAGKTSFFTQGLAAKGVLGKVPPGGAASTVVASAPTVTATTPPTATPVVTRRPLDAGTNAPNGSATGSRDDGTSAAPQPTARSGRREAAATEQRAAEERAREAAETQRRAASERKQAEEAARRAESERRQAEEAARREAERQRWAAEQEQRREAEAERRAEAERQKAEERARRDAEHARRDAEKERRRAEKEARGRPSQEAQAASEDADGGRDGRRGKRGGGGKHH